MTVFNWGEDPAGNWTIRLNDFLICDNGMRSCKITKLNLKLCNDMSLIFQLIY